MPHLRLVKRRHTLVYAMRLFEDQELPERDHQQLAIDLPDGGQATLTLHQISGDKDEIKRKLADSVDAFFEIYGEELP